MITLAEEMGMTAQVAGAILAIAAEELDAERYDTARTILDGLAVGNPYDPGPRLLLAQLHRRTGRLLAARVCAEVAFFFVPEEPEAKLVLAEVLLAIPEESERARAALDEISKLEGDAGARARALLKALGPQSSA